MRRPHFRVRSLMVAVGVMALLIWGAMMGSRSYDYYQRAREYGFQERGWRDPAVSNGFPPEFTARCVEYFAQLGSKYRQAMWRPWIPLAPDPDAPGVREYREQRLRSSPRSRAD